MEDIQKYPTVTSLQLLQSEPGLEKEKKNIYNHPLYPLLALLLEQCEQATCNPDSQTPDTFKTDLQAYINRFDGGEKLLFLTENKDLDSLIVKAIQVLRIHINELRKMNELCKDFCARYINCLKTKIHQDSMFDDSDSSSPSGSERLSPTVLPGVSRGRTYLETGHTDIQQHMLAQMYNVDCADSVNGANRSPSMSRRYINENVANNNYLTSPANSSVYNNLLDPSKQKRGILPKKATQIMKQWLFQHLVHPYPTEDEKRQISNQTNLSLLQVNNWFINARRRILQPMLETSNSPGREKCNSDNIKLDKSEFASDCEDTGLGYVYNSSCGNRKKKAAANRSLNNRFWPASLATAVTIQPPSSIYPPTSPITVIPSDLNPSKPSSSNLSRSHKRSVTNKSNIDIYQPPKIFACSKASYTSYTPELVYKDSKSQSDTSTPQYTELSSPINSKSNSLDDGEQHYLQNKISTSPSNSNHSKTLTKSDLISAYLSNHDPPQSSLLPTSNSCPYISSNPYVNIIMPQTNSFLNHPAMLYNDPNAISSALFGIRHPNTDVFPMYEFGYSNNEQLLDKRITMASQISDLFATPPAFPRTWDGTKYGKTISRYPNSDQQPITMDSLQEFSSLNEYPYSQYGSFPVNFKAFHSKTNLN